MEVPVTRFVIQGEIDDATALEIHELALSKGLRAAAFILPGFSGNPQQPVPDLAVEAHEDVEPQVRADKHDMGVYADSIGFHRSTAGNVWNKLVEDAFDNPGKSPFEFQDIPTFQRRHYTAPGKLTPRPIPERARGLNVTKLMSWVSAQEAELANLQSSMTQKDFKNHVSRLIGGLNSFKFLANFTYAQMGQEVPYDPSTFSTQGRKEKESAIDATTKRLLKDYVVNTEHPMVEPIQVRIRYDAPLFETWGITEDNVSVILTEKQAELGIIDVSRVTGSSIGWDVPSGKTLDGETQAYALKEGLLAKLARPNTTMRTKEVLSAVLSEVLIEVSPDTPS